MWYLQTLFDILMIITVWQKFLLQLTMLEASSLKILFDEIDEEKIHWLNSHRHTQKSGGTPDQYDLTCY